MSDIEHHLGLAANDNPPHDEYIIEAIPDTPQLLADLLSSFEFTETPAEVAAAQQAYLANSSAEGLEAFQRKLHELEPMILARKGQIEQTKVQLAIYLWSAQVYLQAGAMDLFLGEIEIAEMMARSAGMTEVQEALADLLYDWGKEPMENP